MKHIPLSSVDVAVRKDILYAISHDVTCVYRYRNGDLLIVCDGNPYLNGKRVVFPADDLAPIEALADTIPFADLSVEVKVAIRKFDGTMLISSFTEGILYIQSDPNLAWFNGRVVTDLP